MNDKTRKNLEESGEKELRKAPIHSGNSLEKSACAILHNS